MCTIFQLLAITALTAATGHPWPYRRDVFLALESERADFMGLPFEQYRNKREDPSEEPTITYTIGSNFRESPELADVPSMLRQYQSQVLDNPSPDGYQSSARASRSNPPRMTREQNDEDAPTQPRFLIPVFESTADVGSFAPPSQGRRQQQTDQMSSMRNKASPMKKRGSGDNFRITEESIKKDRDDLQFQYYSSDVSRMDRAAEELEGALSHVLSSERSQARTNRQQPSFVTPVDVRQMHLRPSTYHHYNNYRHYDSEEENYCPYANGLYHRREHQPMHRDYYFPFADSAEPHVPVQYFKTKYPNAFNMYEQRCPIHESKPKTRKKNKPKFKPSYPKRIEPEPIPESIIVPVVHVVDAVEKEYKSCEQSHKPQVDVVVLHSSREAKMLDVDEDEASKSLAIHEDSEISAPAVNVEDSGLEEGSYIEDLHEDEPEASAKVENLAPSTRESRKLKLDALQNEILGEVSSEKEVKSRSMEVKNKVLDTESIQTEEVISSAEELHEHHDEDESVEGETATLEEGAQPASHEEEHSEAAEEEEVEVSADNEETAEYTEEEVTATTSALDTSSNVSEETDN